MEVMALAETVNADCLDYLFWFSVMLVVIYLNAWDYFLKRVVQIVRIKFTAKEK